MEKERNKIDQLRSEEIWMQFCSRKAEGRKQRRTRYIENNTQNIKE